MHESGYIAAILARNEERKRARAGVASPCVEDIDALLAALAEALAEAARLRDEHADLHASAILWANLYATCTGNTDLPPPHVCSNTRSSSSRSGCCAKRSRAS